MAVAVERRHIRHHPHRDRHRHDIGEDGDAAAHQSRAEARDHRDQEPGIYSEIETIHAVHDSACFPLASLVNEGEKLSLKSFASMWFVSPEVVAPAVVD